jgi:hypothetical protein
VVFLTDLPEDVLSRKVALYTVAGGAQYGVADPRIDRIGRYSWWPLLFTVY